VIVVARGKNENLSCFAQDVRNINIALKSARVLRGAMVTRKCAEISVMRDDR